MDVGDNFGTRTGRPGSGTFDVGDATYDWVASQIFFGCTSDAHKFALVNLVGIRHQDNRNRQTLMLIHRGKYVANTAVALGMLGRYEESLAHYDLVLPKRDAYLNMAAICEARNDSEGAARHRDLADGVQEA